MSWWLWIVAGLALLALELFAPSGFFLFFIGASAVLTGLLVLGGLGGPAWLPWLICAVLTVTLMIGLRRRLMGRLTAPSKPLPDEQITGQEVVVKEEIKPGGIGQGELRGSSWSVRNIGQSSLQAGQRYTVESIEGLTLKVRG